jgi:UDP-N-acetylmuramyl pentapeptide phosphotransferase/UDP-N-acetylglucosamine-1-phosphate transferase
MHLDGSIMCMANIMCMHLDGSIMCMANIMCMHVDGNIQSAVARNFTDPTSTFHMTLRPGHIPESWLVDYNAALAAIGFMMFLGFADDVLDIRWSVKMLLPMFAALPLLVAYSGGTGIALPKPLQSLLGLEHSFLELGLVYQVRWENLDWRTLSIPTAEGA